MFAMATKILEFVSALKKQKTEQPKPATTVTVSAAKPRPSRAYALFSLFAFSLSTLYLLFSMGTVAADPAGNRDYGPVRRVDDRVVRARAHERDARRQRERRRQMEAAAPEIDYPSSDGRPLAETPLHRDVLVTTIEVLRKHFAADPTIYVSGNMLVFYEKGNRLFTAERKTLCRNQSGR